MSKRFTDRDKRVIEFIQKHKAVNSSQLKRLFGFSDSTLCRRLNFISENSDIKKYRYIPDINFYDHKYKELIPNNNVYYYKRKPTNIMHTLIVTEVYLYLKDRFNIIEYDIEYPITVGDEYLIRADMYIVLSIDNKEYEFLVEVENSKGFNSNKYLKLQEYDIGLPPIVVLSNRRVYNKTNYEIIKGGLNLSDLENKLNKYIIESEFNYKVN